MVGISCYTCSRPGDLAAAHATQPLQHLLAISHHLHFSAPSRSRCDVVIASIYVNPTQFSANEDFGVYPRSTERDLDLLAKAGCVAVFMPAALYHPGSSSLGSGDASMVVGAAQGEAASDAHSTWVNVEGLSQGLCAGSRPHFFRGVATVRMVSVEGVESLAGGAVSCRGPAH